MTASSPRPAGSDTTGGELRSVRPVTREHAVDPRLSDGSPAFTMGSWSCFCGARGANGSWGHAEHVGERVDAALPALRDLLAERDTLTAQVQAVEGLAEEISTEHQDWCCAKGCTYPEKRHSDPNDSITVEELRGIFSANPPPLIEHRTIPCPRDCTCHAQPDADRIRRALGTPTTGGGE